MGLVRTDGWQRYVTNSQEAARQIRRAVQRARGATDRDAWTAIVDRLDPLLEEVRAVASDGTALVQEVDRLDPDALAARLATFQEQATVEPSPDLAEAIHTVRLELEHRRELLTEIGQAQVRLHRAVDGLHDLAQRLRVGHGLGDPRRAAAALDRSVTELAALRPALDDASGS